MDEILKELGISDGFFIPVADDDNKNLEIEVKELQKERELLSSELEDGKTRFTAIEQYLGNLQKETQENLKLIHALNSQIQGDESVALTTGSQIQNLTAEHKEMERILKDVRARQDRFEEESGRASLRLERLRVQVNWDQAALQAWSAAANKIGEEAAILEQFSQQDQEKFEQLEMKRQNLHADVERRRKKFANLSGDIFNLEQTLEKTGYLFANQNQDRQALLDQWRSAIKILQQRDEEINRAMNEIGGLRAQAKQRTRELHEQKQFYENELKNKRELEREDAKLARESRENADSVREMKNLVADLRGQLLVSRGALTMTARQVEANRFNCREMNAEILKKRGQCRRLEDLQANLDRMIEASYSKKFSSDDRVAQMEEIKKQEELTNDQLIHEQNKLQEKIRLVTEELLRLRGIEKEQRYRISGMESGLQNFKNRLNAAESVYQKHQDMLYKSDMLLLEKETEYRRMIGHTGLEETERQEKKLAESERILTETGEAHQLLEREVYRLDQEYRRLVTALDADERDLANLRGKRQELCLQTDGGQKRLNQLRSANQDWQVDENVVRLRVGLLEKAVRRVGGDIYSLERQKLELDEAVKERGMEVDALMDVLGVKKRALLEQLSNLNANINAAKIKVQQLQSKYELTMQSMGTSDGEMMTVTKLKIIAAQERFELQQMGDKLDMKIRQAEREITAMENTLQAVCAANSSYKTSLSRVPSDGPELQEMEKLEQALVTALELIRQKKTTLQDLQEATNHLQDEFQNQLEMEATLLKDVTARAIEVAEINRRLDAQTDKQNRAARDLRLLLKQIHGINQQFQTFEEKDIELRELREQNQSALQQLGETAGRVLETSPVITRYLRERGLTLPQPSARKTPSSRASSISTRSSCVTIDSTALPETDRVSIPPRRHSILRQPKTKPASRAGSLDIVDLVVPQPK